MRQTTLFAVIMLLLGCGTGSRSIYDQTKPEFEIVEKITADSIQLEEAINLYYWKLTEDKVVILDGSRSEGLLSVFSLPEFKLLYSYGRRGKANGEFISSMWLETNKPNSCGLYDIMNRKMHVYQLGEDTLSCVESYSLTNDDKELSKPYTIIQQYSDSIFLFRSDDVDITALELITPTNMQVKKELKGLLERPKQVPYSPYDYLIRKTGNNIAFAYWYIDRIEFYNCKDNLIEPVYSFGSTEGQEKLVEDYDDFVTHYTDLKEDGQFYYAVHQNVKNGINLSTIEVWSHDGKPIKKYELDTYITDIIVDTKRGKMYGYNPLNETNLIYVFAI